MCPLLVVTAPTCNFLRVNDQMHNLDKQKTYACLENVRCKSMTDQKSIANRHFMLSDNFLQLVENVLTETVKNQNIDVYMGPPRDDIREHYRQLTKWSDFRILVPTLFNFFHGIELLLKAANYKVNIPTDKPNHKLANLFADFKINYPNAFIVIDILQKYIYPSDTETNILKAFYSSNNVTDSSQFYEIFKYPFSKDLQVNFNYGELSNLDNEGISFFKQIITDIQTIRIETEKL